MSKPERLEDLGRIRERLQDHVDKFEDIYGHLLSSKHAFDLFVEHLKNDDAIYDLHCFLRSHKERLEDDLIIAIGDVYE